MIFRCRLLVCLFLLVACGAMLGCGEPPTLDPPEVRWGQDVCSACGMILSEDRYAAAIVSIDDDDERSVLLFDDVGEMFESAVTPDGDFRRWVCDAKTRRWVDAEAASFVRSPEIHTPMGRGVAAFADPADAKNKQSEVGGEMLSFDDLQNHPPAPPAHSH